RPALPTAPDRAAPREPRPAARSWRIASGSLLLACLQACLGAWRPLPPVCSRACLPAWSLPVSPSRCPLARSSPRSWVRSFARSFARSWARQRLRAPPSATPRRACRACSTSAFCCGPLDHAHRQPGPELSSRLPAFAHPRAHSPPAEWHWDGRGGPSGRAARPAALLASVPAWPPALFLLVLLLRTFLCFLRALRTFLRALLRTLGRIPAS